MSAEQHKPWCSEWARKENGFCICKMENELAAPAGSVGEPLIPYDEWRALGPEKAAEYLAKRRGYAAEKCDKLRAILDTFWEPEPNKNDDQKPQEQRLLPPASGSALPCPFCGRLPEIIGTGYFVGTDEWRDWVTVCCNAHNGGCGCAQSAPTEEGAWKLWNTRKSVGAALIRAAAKEMESAAASMEYAADPDEWWKGDALKIRAHGMETAAQLLESYEQNDKAETSATRDVQQPKTL